MTKFDFEKTIRSIHDYLYANSEVRTPQKVIDELSKVFSSMIHTEQKNKKNFAFEFSQDELQKQYSQLLCDGEEIELGFNRQRQNLDRSMAMKHLASPWRH